MSLCTWKNCEKEALCEQLDSNNEPWANLCEEHDRIFKDNLIGEPKAVLKNWILAMGGAKKAADRFIKK